MVFYLLLDGSESSTLAQNEKIRDERNSIYLRILKELVDTLISRNKEIYLEVYWGNTVCVRSSVANDAVLPKVEEAMKSNKGNLHLGRLFGRIRSRMKREDAVLLLTDAASFKADITSYPAGMIFAVVVDLLEPNSDQLSELKELTATSNTGKLRDADQWVLRYSNYNDASRLVGDLTKSLLDRDFTTLHVGNLKASVSLYPSDGEDVPEIIEVIGFVRSMNMVNIPVDDVQFITPSPIPAYSARGSENCPPDSDDQPEFVRTEEQDGGDLLGTIGPALLDTESVAIALIDESKYACITAEKVGEDFCLILNRFPDRMPEFVPDFSSLIAGPDEQGEPLHFTTLQGAAPSYGPVVQSWVREHGFNMDFQKMMRLLRKLPDRPHLFYLEVNRFRRYALAIGMDHVLHEAARIIREEIGPLNAVAQKHGAYVATAFDMENPRDTPEIAQL